jgi:hypothetical protein
MRTRRPLSLGLVAAGVLAGVVVPSASRAATTCGGNVVQPRPAGWTTIAAPNFPQHNNLFTQLQGFWASPVDPKVMLATDFFTILRTSDSGCHWRPVYAVSSQPSEPTDGAVPWDTDGRIKQIVSSSVSGTVYALIYTVDAPRLMIVRSRDGGATWTRTAASGLSPISLPTLFVSPTKPDAVYLTGGFPSNAYLHYIFASTDGAATWQQRSGPVEDSQNNSRPVSVRVSPADPLDVWLYGGSMPLRHSTDGGRTWSTVPAYTFTCPATTTCSHDARAVALLPRRGHEPDVWLCADVPWDYDAKKFFVRHSTDGGRTFTTVFTPNMCSDLAVSASGTLVLDTVNNPSDPKSTAGLYRFDPKRGSWVDFSPLQYKPHRNLGALFVTNGRTTQLTGLGGGNPTTIERWSGRL